MKFRNLISLVIVALFASLANQSLAQTYPTAGPTAVTKDASGDLISQFAVKSGQTINLKSGSTLTINGALSGTPNGGTLNLSNVTLTPPSNVATLTGTQTLTNKDLSAATNTYRAASETVTGAVELATSAEAEAGTSTTLSPTVSGASLTAIKLAGYELGERNKAARYVPAGLGKLLTQYVAESPNGLNFSKPVTIGEQRNIWRYTEDFSYSGYGMTSATKGTDTIVVDGVTLTKVTFTNNFYGLVSSNIQGLGLTPFTTGVYYLCSFFVMGTGSVEQWPGFARGSGTANNFERKLIEPGRMRRVWRIGKAISNQGIDFGGVGTVAFGAGGSIFVNWLAAGYPLGASGDTTAMEYYVGGFQIEAVTTDDRQGIVCIGDSTMAGGSGGNDSSNSLEWVSMLGAHLNVHVFNRGVGGNNTAAMNARWATDITPLAARCKYAIIQPSAANDIPNGVSFATTQTETNAMVAKAVADSLIPVIVVPPSTSNINANAGYKATYDQLIAWLRTFPRTIDHAEVCNDPWNPYVLRQQTGWVGDGVHDGAESKRARAKHAAERPFWDFVKPSAYQKIAVTTYTPANLSVVGSLGYGTGAGGTITQGTSKSTGVTLNKLAGQVTTHNAALAAGASVSFTLTNSTIAAADIVHVTIASGATADAYTVTVTATAAGSCRVQIRNNSGGSLSEALVLNFAVLKGATAMLYQQRTLGALEEYPLAV